MAGENLRKLTYKDDSRATNICDTAKAVDKHMFDQTDG